MSGGDMAESPSERLRGTAVVALASRGWRVLVVGAGHRGDDPLVRGLRRHGHEVVGCAEGAAAPGACHEADLVLLDLDLPDLDGLRVCRAIRAVSGVPLLVLSPRHSEAECVLSLHAGADDYVVTSHGLRELTARIEAVMRRSRAAPVGAREILRGRLRIDVDSREVSLDGRGVRLTRKEFDLLYLLASHPDTVIPRKQLLCQVWGDTWSRRTVDTHVSSLRSKLGGRGWIITVRGVGFKLGSG